MRQAAGVGSGWVGPGSAREAQECHPCSGVGPGHAGSALHHPGRQGSVHWSSPTSQAEVQMEAWGPRGFAVTKDREPPRPCLFGTRPGQRKISQDPSRGCRYNIIPLNLGDKLWGYCFRNLQAGIKEQSGWVTGLRRSLGVRRH